MKVVRLDVASVVVEEFESSVVLVDSGEVASPRHILSFWYPTDCLIV